MAWKPGSGWLRWPAGPAGARRRSPAGRRWPAARAGGSAAWSSLHSPDCPDDPGRGVSGDGQPVQPDDAQERGLVGVGGGDHERVPSLDRGRAGHSGRGQVVPGCGLRGAGVHLGTLPSDGWTGQDLFSADPGRLGRDVACVLLGVDLAAEVDGESHQDDHHQAGCGEPDAHRRPFPIPARTGCGDGHHRSRYVSRGLDMVAVMALLPGTPGSQRSDRLTSQVTVALIFPGVPTGEANPLVSTLTVVVAQFTCWLARLVAAVFPSVWAPPWVRAMDAERAASAAADCTAWWAIATRPAKTMRATNSMKAGTPITASMTAEPRSRSRCLGQLIG